MLDAAIDPLGQQPRVGHVDAQHVQQIIRDPGSLEGVVRGDLAFGFQYGEVAIGEDAMPGRFHAVTQAFFCGNYSPSPQTCFVFLRIIR